MRKFVNYEVTGLARRLAVELYALVRTFPQVEQYGVAQQIRRAAVSVGANIAEGAGRFSSKDFGHFLTQAIGSACELEYLLLISIDLGYISGAERDRMNDMVQTLKSKLFRFRETLLQSPT